MKAAGQNCPAALFTVLYKVILAFESVDEILNCDHSDGSYFRLVHFAFLYLPILVVFLSERIR